MYVYMGEKEGIEQIMTEIREVSKSLVAVTHENSIGKSRSIFFPVNVVLKD